MRTTNSDFCAGRAEYVDAIAQSVPQARGSLLCLDDGSVLAHHRGHARVHPQPVLVDRVILVAEVCHGRVEQCQDEHEHVTELEQQECVVAQWGVLLGDNEDEADEA